jgi:hypothetical protein
LLLRGSYNGCNAMTIADYFAIGVLIILALWGVARLIRRA